MRASKHTCGSATAEHRLNILRQEEIDRQTEEAEYPTGGYRLGDASSAALLRPRHVGLTSTQEHAMWLQDISQWQGEYQALLADLGRVQAFVVANGDALRKHIENLAGVVAEHDAMADEYAALKAKHLRARRAHEQAAEHHADVMRRVRRIANGIREAFGTPGKSEPQPGCAAGP